MIKLFDNFIKKDLDSFDDEQSDDYKITPLKIESRYKNLTEGICWYKNGKFIKDDRIDTRPTLMTVNVQPGDKVECIEYVTNERKDRKMTLIQCPIYIGEIKTVNGFNSKERRVYFTDTPSGAGNYDGSCFVKID